MTFGLYISRHSPIHRLSARCKVGLLAVAGVSVFLISHVIGLAGLLAVVMIMMPIAKLPYAAVMAQFRPVVPLLIAILLLQGLWGDWLSGWIAVLRFAILIGLATLVTLTTRLSEMTEAIEQGLTPLKRFGINPVQVSFMLTLALRFIPILLHQFHEIQEAQQARGLDRHPIALFVPFLVKTLRMADEVSEALDARGYGGE